MNKSFLIIAAVLIANCSGFKIQPRIINGFSSLSRQFPYYVYLETKHEQNKLGTCSGVLISDKWIVTAGHCVDVESKMTAYFGYMPGGYMPSYVANMSLPQSNRFIHPLFIHETYSYDLALIELPVAVELGPFIEPVTFPKNCGEELKIPIAAIIAGNGRIAFDNDFIDDILRFAYLATVRPDDCRAFANNPADPKSLICAFSSKGNSICLGDSGGPLLREYDEALIGISSYVRELVNDTTKEISYFQVFSNIYYHFDWIANITGLQLPKC